jgi:FecR protein
MTGNELGVVDRSEFAGRRLGGWVLGLAALAIGAHALVPVLRADDANQPARAVRLGSVDGQVQISQGDQVITESSVANTPLFEGARITTADNGRAEIQFEDGSVARLSPNSSFTLTVLRGSGVNAQAEITLEGGLAYFELDGADQAGTITVKFGDSVATPSGFTVMRVDLDNPPGVLAVFSGNAHLDRGTAASVDLHGGESVALSANDDSRYTLNESVEPDSWDSWNADRDQALTSEAANATGASKGYGQANNPAWSDLDANGNWYNVPGQGDVWSPNDAADPGFDPYGNGYWALTPAGYAWASGYSWGYMPYQCGLWNWYDGFGWGWAPGMRGCNPWWGFGGVGYFAPNIGSGYGGYRPPLRPPLHPRQPRRPVVGGLIAVNRHLPAPVSSLPARDKTTVVRIAGYTVQPMHALSPRPQYDRTTVGYGNRTVVLNGGAVPATGQYHAPGPGYVAGHPASSTSGPKSAPRSTVTSHPAPAPAASHVSSGGGGGGAVHAAAGGGGHH